MATWNKLYTTIYLLDGPLSVLSNEQLRILASVFQGREGLHAAPIPQGNGNIAQETAPLGSFDRCALEALTKTNVIQRHEIDQHGRDFVRVAASDGVREVITRRDGPFGDYSQAPADQQPRKRSDLT